MGKYTLQGIILGVVVFLFFMSFGSGIVVMHYNEYDLDSNYGYELSNFSDEMDNLTTFSSSVEDSAEDLKPTVSDTQGVLGTIGTIKKIINFRTTAKSTVQESQNILDFMPKEFWTMVILMMVIIITIIFIGLLWRYKEGLS